MNNFKSIGVAAIVIIIGFSQCNFQNIQKEMNTNSQADTTYNQIIVDVRSTEEWNFDGHANCSVNIPLDSLESKVEELKKYNKVVLVCRSGSRASYAKSFLESAGFANVENKGAWQNISCKE